MMLRFALILSFALGHVAAASEPSPYSDTASYPANYEQPAALPSPTAGASANGGGSVTLASEVPHQAGPILLASAPEHIDTTSPPPAAIENGQPADDTARRLRRTPAQGKVETKEETAAAREASPLGLLDSDATTTALTATALVVGLFLICAWTFRRSLPKSSRPLPREAVEILGRCPLGNKQYAHLLHVGNKVVLVSVTAAGAETLVEVDDPNEVARILGICASSSQGSASKEFDAIFQQFAKEPARGFVGEDFPYRQGSGGGTRV